MHDGTVELVEDVDAMQLRSRTISKRKHGQQLPGAACHFLRPDSCSPCGRFCLLRVHHASECVASCCSSAVDSFNCTL